MKRNKTMARQNLPFSPKKHCINTFMVIPLQMDISSPILPYYGSQKIKILLFTFLLLKQEWMLHGKQSFSQKTPLLPVPEPQELTFSGMRGAEKALPCVMLLQCADLLCPTLWQLITAVHLVSIRRGLYSCKTKLSAP